MRWSSPAAAVMLVLLFARCGGDSSTMIVTNPGGMTPQVALSVVATGLTVPVGMESLPDGRIFIIEQPGRIQIIRNGAKNAAPFLDITSRVESGGEKGLLGLAFHPAFAQNRRFFVNYTRRVGTQLQTVISEFTASMTTPDVVDPATERIVLVIDQPFDNHNGGQIAFGPDGFLYIGMGDGGSEGDPLGNGQNTNVLLGKMLRIDVDSAVPYGIPPDNPFVMGDGRPEIFAFGFRNPWRFSFDPTTSRLFVADVGESNREEIDIATRGGNFGWNIMEGTQCFQPPSGCNQQGLILPIFDYPHTDGATVIGGFVYRGSAIPGLVGLYVFGDFSNGRMWTLREAPGTWTRSDLLSTGLSISSFGRDPQGELYILDYAGRLLKIVPQ